MAESQHFAEGTYVVVQQRRALVNWNLGNGVIVVTYEDGEVDLLRPLGLRHDRTSLVAGSRVRIVEDEYDELVGTEWYVDQFSRDYTCVWLTKNPEGDPYRGLWAAIANLVPLTDQPST